MLQNATVQISMQLWGAIICMMFASFIAIGQQRKSRRGVLLIGLMVGMTVLLVSDCLAWAYRGDPSWTGFYMVRISNYLVFIMNYVIGLLALFYLESLLEKQQMVIQGWMKAWIMFVCIMGISLVTISQFSDFLYTFDANNLYSRSSGFWVISALAGVLVISFIGMILYYVRYLRRIQAYPLLLVFVLALLADVVQFLIYGISLVNIAMTVGVLGMFFAYQKELDMQTAAQQTRLLENALRISEQETELARKNAELAVKDAQLTQRKTQIMLSQIQPHFLYNALAAISYLCIKDPMKARSTIDALASYLRTNLDSLRNEHLVPFEKELEHTKTYLQIEKTRFDDDLQIVYDIQYTDFILPSLSLQPLAENAVRHGICASEDGGTLTICTEKKDDKIYITVIDDGVGFDMTQKPQDGRSHVGMENVSDRIRSLCGGELIVHSEVGKGTTAVIVLPAKQGE